MICCAEENLELLKLLYEMETHLSYESLGIYRCKKCGRLWKIRFQCDAGTGEDDIWLKPGENERGYSFSIEEAEKYQQKERREGICR